MAADAGRPCDLEEQPYKWSQRWFDDPPVGTIAGPDIYVGNGEWQPLDETAN